MNRVLRVVPGEDAARGPRPRAIPMQDLTLLGILMDGPQHGYEIRQLMQTRLGQLATITVGTIYYTLQKLEKRGLVGMERGREGKRPERMTYSITDAGRAELRRLIKRAFADEDLPYSSFDVGIYFLPHGDLEDALAGATRQVERLASFEEHVLRLEKDYPVTWPFNLEAIKRHTLAITAAHKSFYKDLQAELRNRIARARTRRPAATAAARRREHHG